MPGTPAIRFALAGAVLGVVGAVAALTLTGGDGSAPVAASPGTTTSTVTEPATTVTTAVPRTRKVKITVGTVTEQTVSAYASCADAAAATARRAARYDGSSAALATLGSAALRTSEQCAQTAAKLQDELQAAVSTNDHRLLVAVARYAGVAQRQAASAASLATGLASARSPRRAARAYIARGAKLAAAAHEARQRVDRARRRAGLRSPKR